MKSSVTVGLFLTALVTLGATTFAAMPSSSRPDADQCMAQCPDGYEYPRCSEDGQVINYFADPCMFHSSSSSSGNTVENNALTLMRK